MPYVIVADDTFCLDVNLIKPTLAKSQKNEYLTIMWAEQGMW